MKVLPVQLNTYKGINANYENHDCSKPCPKPYNSNTDLKYMPVYFGNIASKASQKLTTNFAKEIAAQPEVLEKLIGKYFNKTGTVNMDLNITPEQMQQFKRIHIIASGSSKNASEMAATYIEKSTDVPVIVESASEFMCKKSPINPTDDLFIYVSQSGQTADTLKALEKTNRLGINSIAITNKPESVIATRANSHIYLDAGEEKAVAATKTVTSSIFNLMAIGLKLGELKGSLESKLIDYAVTKLKYLPDKIRTMLKYSHDVEQASNILAKADNICYYAKGSNIGAAKEGALKLTETTGKRVISDSSGEALHGTFASIKPENPVVQIITGNYDYNYTSAEKNIIEIINKRKVKNPIIITEESNKLLKNELNSAFKDKKITYLGLPNTHATSEELSPILATVKFQQLTEAITRKLGIDPDNGNGFLTKFRKEI